MKKAKSHNPVTGAEALAIRKTLNLNQSQFWAKIGVTQSGGSRYESGRTIPRPVQKLITIAYGKTGESAAVVNQLRT